MAEKVLNTKIALLYKSYEDWDAKKNYVPLKGEVCFCEVPASTGAVASEPCVLFKVGDGVKTFENLPWASALAADIYSWAKKSSLDFTDLSQDFKEKIKEYVGGANTLYRIVADGYAAWKLQKSEDDGATWVDASGNIDLSDIVETFAEELAAKVERQIVGANGTARIFNEADGGGAKFEHSDGSEAFVGVNDGGLDGMMAQIYADKLEDGSWVGSRINIYHDGIYYVSKANQLAGYSKNDERAEIATKGDIEAIGKALHFIGIAVKDDGETEIEAVERTYPADEQTDGAIAICGAKEFICYGNPKAWNEFGDVSAYATKAELDAEVDRAVAAEADLDDRINNLADIATTGNVNDLQQTDGDILILNCNL